MLEIPAPPETSSQDHRCHQLISIHRYRLHIALGSPFSAPPNSPVFWLKICRGCAYPYQAARGRCLWARDKTLKRAVRSAPRSRPVCRFLKARAWHLYEDKCQQADLLGRTNVPPMRRVSVLVRANCAQLGTHTSRTYSIMLLSLDRSDSDSFR